MSLATLWRGELQLPSKGPGAARVFMSASLTSLSYAPAGAAIPGSVRARFIARRSACLPFGLLLESEVNLALWQQDALKGVPLARGPLSISEHHRLSF